jgi:uncharacterized OB-fold protein
MTDADHEKVELPKPRPLPTPTSLPFWDALDDDRVILQRCGECDAWIYYPRSRCPECLSDQLVWTQVGGEGVIFTFTVTRQPTVSAFADEVPQIIAVIELTEGVHVTSVIVDAEPEQVTVGAAVVPVFEHGDDGRTLLKHRLVDGAADVS